MKTTFLLDASRMLVFHLRENSQYRIYRIQETVPGSALPPPQSRLRRGREVVRVPMGDRSTLAFQRTWSSHWFIYNRYTGCGMRLLSVRRLFDDLKRAIFENKLYLLVLRLFKPEALLFMTLFASSYIGESGVNFVRRKNNLFCIYGISHWFIVHVICFLR